MSLEKSGRPDFELQVLHFQREAAIITFTQFEEGLGERVDWSQPDAIAAGMNYIARRAQILEFSIQMAERDGDEEHVVGLNDQLGQLQTILEHGSNRGYYISLKYDLHTMSEKKRDFARILMRNGTSAVAESEEHKADMWEEISRTIPAVGEPYSFS